MRIFLLLLLSLVFNSLPAQSIRLLYAGREYEEVVKQFGHKETELDEEELYMLGFSFFQTGQDEKAITYYDKAIAGGFDSAFVHFYKGIAYRYLDKMEPALAAFDKAIERSPSDQEYVCEKAFTYYRMEKYDTAILLYEKARQLPNSYQAPGYMIPHIWYLQGKDELALQGFYDGLATISPDNRHYAMALMDIGKIERLLKKNYSNALAAYYKIVKEDATHYAAWERLMIVHHLLKQSLQADSIFTVLKNAYLDGKLPEEMMKFKRAQIAEYDWNEKPVMIFKNFDMPAKVPEVMLTGYLLDKSGEKVERIFQTEKTFEFGKDSPKHILCERGVQRGRYNYGVGWKTDDITPGLFFDLIKQVLDGKIKPMAASGF